MSKEAQEANAFFRIFWKTLPSGRMECRFCGFSMTDNFTRFTAHLCDEPGCGTSVCSVIYPDLKTQVIKVRDILRSNRDGVQNGKELRNEVDKANRLLAEMLSRDGNRYDLPVPLGGHIADASQQGLTTEILGPATEGPLENMEIIAGDGSQYVAPFDMGPTSACMEIVPATDGNHSGISQGYSVNPTAEVQGPDGIPLVEGYQGENDTVAELPQLGPTGPTIESESVPEPNGCTVPVTANQTFEGGNINIDERKFLSVEKKDLPKRDIPATRMMFKEILGNQTRIETELRVINRKVDDINSHHAELKADIKNQFAEFKAFILQLVGQ